MSNCPQGTEYDSAAPWNERPISKCWRAWYITTAHPDGENDDILNEWEVFFPSDTPQWEAVKLAKVWCDSMLLDYVEVLSESDNNLTTILTNEHIE
jgi:hypothetical protein